MLRTVLVMGKADGGLRKELQKGLPKPEWLWTPIETGGTHGGVPDSYFVNRMNKIDGWVECKATDGWAVKFESHQVQWLMLRAAAGVLCRVAVRGRGVGSGGGRGDSLWIYRGQHAELLDIGDLRTVEPLYVGYGSPREWDWVAIREALILSV